MLFILCRKVYVKLVICTLYRHTSTSEDSFSHKEVKRKKVEARSARSTAQYKILCKQHCMPSDNLFTKVEKCNQCISFIADDFPT